MSGFLEIKHVSKSFYGVPALKDISFTIAKGSVHAVMGENGAGKSTLMKILGGVYQADEGEVLICQKRQKLDNVQDAQKAGISVIYQEFNLIPDLTVAENIFIVNTPKKRGLVDKRLRNEKAEELLKSLNIDINPRVLVKDLSVSKKQMVEIAKALSHDSEIIIMDEPTAALNDDEVVSLGRMIQHLKEQGKTVIYISHRLKEVFDMADTVTVLRDGTYVDTKPISELTENLIIKLMVGHEINGRKRRESHVRKEVVLKVRNLSKAGLFEDVSFDLHKGEILGAAGLMGCGREEMLSALYGLIKADSGQVWLDGEQIQIKSVKDALHKGICFLTDDRKESGIFPLMSVQENMTMISIRNLKKKLGFYLRAQDELAQLNTMTEIMNIKYSDPSQKISFLSGGNQQKVLLGRNLLLQNKVFIMLEPARGIDVGAKEEIYKFLHQLTEQGMGVLAVFSDMNELIQVCDRALVFWQGRITGDIKSEDFNKEKILSHAAGRGGKL